ncbi:hypothetical protein HanRHA438_Chr11g0508471 [Helianthus annuus]|uniref:Uncharacterized protein n=1 Tax=Helianthus annuus TaxID=4232 RepID=A0A9K3N0D4_HELAN|nr:hypothetical protein HanXRQr2_Chr11g0495851 [Helianthus annuus]KAJ0501921.1 hypothetical protein HanHA300_Chr11g0406651 [Helianthus annuus]KAJ0509857.1 hypothetical protein HanIR_Chr11g0533901 [Helianthus annuus]KAJ0517850.1 hypothetical protein HanHA89_Chr11g0430401 [Helianthus annuus]KAJ0685866.1 hypothetical protein HanLR1_Chr11g0407891 [Helianthus annuus]
MSLFAYTYQMPIFACIHPVIVINISAHAMIIMLQVHMSSSESGLSEDHDPMAVVSDDEIAPDPEVFTSDTENDPDMLSDDEDDFQPFALPDFGDNTPFADGVPVDDIFAIPIPIHDHLIIGHPDGEHHVVPILDVVPLFAVPHEDLPFDDLDVNYFDIFTGDHPVGDQGDGVLDDVIVLDIPSPVVSIIDISSNSSMHSVADSFESVTSLALQAKGLRLYATDLDDEDTMSTTPSSPVRAPTPPPVPDHVHDPVPGPFDIPLIAPLVPEPISAPFGLPPISPVVPQPPPTVDVPPPFVSDEHRTDLPIVFRHEIPAPRPGEGTSGQPPSFDPFASADFPPIPQFTPFTSDPLDQPFRWFPSYTMPISDPYHPSHHVGYTRDDLLLSL